MKAFGELPGMPPQSMLDRVLDFLDRRAAEHDAKAAQCRRLIQMLRKTAPDVALLVEPGEDVPPR